MKSSKLNRYYCLTPKLKYLIIILFLSFHFIHNDLSGNAFADEPFYSIQLDTFNNLENAERRVTELKGLGHNSFYRSETLGDDGGEIYKVYIERYGSRSEAENEAKVLKDLELIPDYMVVEIKEKGEEEVEKKTRQPEPEPVREGPEDDGYLIQVGVYKEKENADEILLKLKNSGHSPFFRQEEVKGKGEVYRVYIKGFQSKAEAQKTGKELMESGLISGYMVKAPGVQTQTLISKKANDKNPFFLHVASYKEEANAEQYVQFLADNGLKAFYVPEQISGVKWFRVYIGEFNDEESAKKAGAELLEKGIISYFKPLEINRGGNGR